MSIDYGMYSGWTARDLLSGKGTIPSPFPSGVVPPDWEWQNFLNYGGDGQAQEQLKQAAAPLTLPEPEKPKAEKPKKPAKPKLVLGKDKALKRKLPPKKRAKK